MLAVLNILSTSFCAVPDFMRVEPVTASAPTTGQIPISGCFITAESGLQVTPTVVQPTDLA